MSVRHHRKNKSTLSLHILTSYLKLSIMFHEFLYSLEKLKKYTVLFSSAFLDFYKTFLHILYECFSYSNTNIFPLHLSGAWGSLKRIYSFLSIKKSNMFLLHCYKNWDTHPVVLTCPNCKNKENNKLIIL